MGGFIQQPPLGEKEESNLRPVLVAMTLIAAAVVVLVLISRGTQKSASAPHPYASNVQLSNIKMSAAENFVGSSVTYIDGTVTNAGNQIVSHAVVHVIFKNSMDQVAQAENVPLLVLKTGGPYADTTDLSSSPLAPTQSKQFRLTFEHVTTDWNQNYPQLQVTDVTLK